MNAIKAEDKKSICDAYNKSNNKKGDILLWAQSFGAKPSEILAILTAAGLEVPEGADKSAPEKEKAPQTRRYTPEQKAEMVKARQKGASLAEAGRLYGASGNQVKKWVLAAEKKPSPPKVNPEVDACFEKDAEKEPEKRHPKAGYGQMVSAFLAAYDAMTKTLPGCPEWEDLDSYVTAMRGYAAGLDFAVKSGWKEGGQ